MHRKPLIRGALGAGCLALPAALLAITAGSASGQLRVHAAPRVSVVTVTIGKPSELAFKLSKFSNLPTGATTFKVTNRGLGIHNFKICTVAVKTTAKNACVGKATPLLKSGMSATLTVVLTKKGTYEYLCAVPGHAAAGMKGLLGVGVKVTAPAAGNAGSTTTTTTTTAGSTTTTPVGTPPPPPAGGGGGGGAAGECPPGQTIAANGGKDEDADDDGAPSDGDGCL
jgi:uncharacterized cupredoxin-like copper-binding protein